MADLATVRTEIKTWERSFKDSKGRAPTLDDIKANNAIAEKYKLYKRLSKAAVSSNSTHPAKSTSTPSTPPRSAHPKASTSILRSTSRTVEPSAPLAAFNPFSPQKKLKGKGKDRDISSLGNEFISNLVTKPQTALHARKQSFSPDLSPSKQSVDSKSYTTTLSYALPLPTSPINAVSRARKRLRGEPVSPSPNKDKRRRVSSQTTLPFPRLNLDVQSDEEEVPPDADSSFVDNSPMKAPKAGKSFPALFQHDIVPVDLFGIKSNLEILNVDSKNLSSGNRKPVDPDTRRKLPARTSNPTKTARVPPTSGSAELLGQRIVSKLPAHSHDTDKGNQSEASSNRSSAKRALSEDIDQNVVLDPRAKPPLLPPSPPPESNSTTNKTGKSKSYLKGNFKGRKKSKLDIDTVEDGGSDEEEPKAKLRIVNRHDTRSYCAIPMHDEDGVTSDSDPNLGNTRFAAPRAASPNNSQLKDGNVEIDLPEQLRSVLALDSAPNHQVPNEDRLVKSLLYGRRVTHYDPNKGGEIWDIGENDFHDPNDENARYTEGEDDWEGEPVPWEVGEL